MGDDFDTFINNNIGKIVGILDNKKYPYIVKYETSSTEIIERLGTECCRQMMRDEIIHFSKNKEDLEYILAAKKYNL